MPTPTSSHRPVGPEVPGWTPRELPRPGPFHGSFCTVVPLRRAYARTLYADCGGAGNEDLWTYLSDGPMPAPAPFAARVARMLADPDRVPVAVLDRDGTPRGWASYLRLDPDNGSVEVGDILFGRSLQRTPAATEAMYLMARHVFEDLGYRRYEWKCDALNAPSRSAAERLGFRYEGTHRQAVVYKGRSRDTSWYSITDAEWPAVAEALRQWLDPANFDGTGRQRHRLADLHRGLQDSRAECPGGETPEERPREG